MFDSKDLEFLATLIAEHKDWEFHNFGRQSPIHSLLGIQEEVGELSHAVLKFHQGIRLSKEEAFEKMSDAIGDICIYLVSFHNRIGVDLIRKNRADFIVDFALRNKVLLPHTLVTERKELPLLMGATLSKLHQLLASSPCDDEGEYSILEKEEFEGAGQLMLYLCESFSQIVLKKSAIDCIRKAWDEVKARDWKYNPWNGQTNLPLE